MSRGAYQALLLFRDIYRDYYGIINKKEDDVMLWVGVILVLVGAFLIGKSSDN